MEDHCPNNCNICKREKEICFYEESNKSFQCVFCKEYFNSNAKYEYRGQEHCCSCKDKAELRKDCERETIIEKNKAATDKFKGLDLSSNSKIGRANRKIFGLKI
jgi:hypothetical protein